MAQATTPNFSAQLECSDKSGDLFGWPTSTTASSGESPFLEATGVSTIAGTPASPAISTAPTAAPVFQSDRVAADGSGNIFVSE